VIDERAKTILRETEEVARMVMEYSKDQQLASALLIRDGLKDVASALRECAEELGLRT
jgi:hypothetical protein